MKSIDFNTLSSSSLGSLNGRVQVDRSTQGLDYQSGMGVGRSTSFSELLEQSFDQVNENQLQADRAIHELVAGRTKNIHETMLTIERADASLKLLTQVRNKILDAYKEIMKMQV